MTATEHQMEFKNNKQRLENCAFPYRIGLFHEDCARRNTCYGKNAFQNRRVLKHENVAKYMDPGDKYLTKWSFEVGWRNSCMKKTNFCSL